MKKQKDKTKLGALFYPTSDTSGKLIPFETLCIPHIYKEVYFEGVYRDVLKGKKDMIIVDVGANIGIVTQYMRPYAKKIYAIEPSGEHFEALSKNKTFNGWDNVELFKIALSDRNGEMDLVHNAHNRTMNSLAVDTGKNPVSGNLIGKMGKHGYYQMEKVKTMDMETFFTKNKIKIVDFMKFDVEGAEEMILRSNGFRKVSDRIKNIEIEFHFPDWEKLVAHMQGLGFTARRYDSSVIVVLFTR